ncbi:MAG TPA: ATP synthase subunit I [Candidatus Faecousia intestinigallinarum]|nr:ATP synthase subunit I [Candidatus Faecousia intestinigallinarum]
MDSRKIVLKETAVVALGQAVCVGVMLAVYALLGKFSIPVLLGGIVGGILALANFLFMAISANLAADKAEKQDVAGGKALIQRSFLLRLAVLALLLFACVKSGFFDLIALLLPLLFVRPVLTVAAFFEKKEGSAS